MNTEDQIEQERKARNDRATEIATTILNQLGGRKFLAMTGAKDPMASLPDLDKPISDDNPASLVFRLPGGGGFCKDGINHVRVVYTQADDYNMTFSRIRGSKVTTVKEHKGVYCDQLQAIFTEATGLATSL